MRNGSEKKPGIQQHGMTARLHNKRAVTDCKTNPIR